MSIDDFIPLHPEKNIRLNISKHWETRGRISSQLIQVLKEIYESNDEVIQVHEDRLEYNIDENNEEKWFDEKLKYDIFVTKKWKIYCVSSKIEEVNNSYFLPLKIKTKIRMWFVWLADDQWEAPEVVDWKEFNETMRKLLMLFSTDYFDCKTQHLKELKQKVFDFHHSNNVDVCESWWMEYLDIKKYNEFMNISHKLFLHRDSYERMSNEWKEIESFREDLDWSYFISQDADDSKLLVPHIFKKWHLASIDMIKQLGERIECRCWFLGDGRDECKHEWMSISEEEKEKIATSLETSLMSKNALNYNYTKQITSNTL